MVELLEEHYSPDGKLCFQMTRDVSAGRVILAFAGSCWHTHPDFLAADYGLAEPEVVRKCVDDLLADRLVIGVFRRDGEDQEVSIEVDPGRGYEWIGPVESIEYRYWSGRVWEGQ